MDRKTENILMGISGTVEETQKLIEDCRFDIERKKGVVGGLQAAATSLHALAASKVAKLKTEEDEGKASAGDATLVKCEIKGINGSHGVLLELLSANQREQRIAEGRMAGYCDILQKTEARVIALKQKYERRQRENKSDGKVGPKKGRPEPVRKALGRDKAPGGEKKKAARKKASKKKGK